MRNSANGHVLPTLVRKECLIPVLQILTHWRSLIISMEALQSFHLVLSLVVLLIRMIPVTYLRRMSVMTVPPVFLRRTAGVYSHPFRQGGVCRKRNSWRRWIGSTTWNYVFPGDNSEITQSVTMNGRLFMLRLPIMLLATRRFPDWAWEVFPTITWNGRQLRLPTWVSTFLCWKTVWVEQWRFIISWRTVSCIIQLCHLLCLGSVLPDRILQRLLIRDLK